MSANPKVDVLLTHGFFLKNDPKQMEKMRPYPPLGALYAASHLRRRGHQVALFDSMLAAGEHEFEAALEGHRPAVVAFYEDSFNFLTKMCLSHAREATCRMSAVARAGGATVIAAGSDASDHAEVYLDHGVDYVLVGEADHTLVELVDALGGPDPAAAAEGIDGLALPARNGGAIRRTPPRAPERHPDVFPLPAWDLVDGERYRAAWRRAHGYFSLNIVSTRGCPFHCTWCAKPIWGRRFAMRSPADVAEEMALLKALHRPDHLWFADDIFGLRPAWISEFAGAVEARGASVPFTIQSRVDLMTAKAVPALARAGCTEVWLGVESGSQKILDAMDKGTRVEQVPAARERLRKAGIRAGFFLQFGYPGEGWEDIRATVELVRATLPDDIGVSVSYPLPGTRFHDQVAAQLGDQTHWRESDDLAMMFQGTYRTGFYRRLHRMVHRELELRLRLARGGPDGRGAGSELEGLAAEWRRLERTEAEHRSVAPTGIRRDDAEPRAPDLSRPWN